MVADDNDTYCDERLVKYMIVESLCGAPLKAI